MKFLQRLGKAIMLPVACLPLCGILMGVGYLLCPASMQGGSIEGFWQTVGWFLVRSGGALIDHIALLFAVGVGVGMAEDRDGAAGLAALVAWLVTITVLKADFLKQALPGLLAGENAVLAFEKIENPFIGILTGLIGAKCYDRFKKASLPEWLAFFSGKRSGVIVSGVAAVLFSALLLIVWPLIFGGLTRLGQWIAGLGPLGAGLYAFLNRLLIPFGLHHALNNVFWFDTIGLGDLTHFWAGETSADVTWSLGMYMSGFFPCMMFGIPGAALAMARSWKGEERRKAAGMVGSSALCAFVCGISEPFEFMFMFTSPGLYVLYALLYGLFSWAVAASGFRAGFSFSAGATDLLFSASLPAAGQTWLILPFGLAAFVLFYLVFHAVIRRRHLRIPDVTARDAADGSAEAESDAIEGFRIRQLLEGLGGAENIASLDNCVTRLRVEVHDGGRVDQQALKAAGARGVMLLGGGSVQVVIGTKVQQVADALRALLAREEKPALREAPGAVIRCPAGEVLCPVKGRVIAREQIPDETFASGIMGEGVGIEPEEGVVTAPFDGEVVSAAASGHAVGLCANDMEVLIHVGVDTVNMKGAGFTCLVREGDIVKQGQALIRFDRQKILEAGYSDVVAVMLTNSDELEPVQCFPGA